MFDYTVVVDFTQNQRRIFASRESAKKWILSRWDIAGWHELGNDHTNVLAERHDDPVCRLKPASFGDLFPQCQRDHGEIF